MAGVHGPIRPAGQPERGANVVRSHCRRQRHVPAGDVGDDVPVPVRSAGDLVLHVDEARRDDAARVHADSLAVR